MGVFENSLKLKHLSVKYELAETFPMKDMPFPYNLLMLGITSNFYAIAYGIGYTMFRVHILCIFICKRIGTSIDY